MARQIALTDDKRRDAQVALVSAKKADAGRYVGPDGQAVKYEKFVKTTERETHEALLARLGGPEALGQALIAGDPELDLEQVGRRLGKADKVWLDPDGRVLFSARTLRVHVGPDGVEKERTEFVDVEATVRPEAALKWSGRLFDQREAVRKFVFTRQVQLKHVNGLTYDFLLDIARTLEQSGKLLFLGSGARGVEPLIFATNGTPFRGFLEGRTEGDAYRVVLHLTNLELKAVMLP